MENKELLLQSALELFYARGYDGVGVQEIAEKAGVTKPTLYYYFGSKRGLLESLLSNEYAVMEEEIAQATRTGTSLPDTLYQVARAFFDYATRKRKFYLFMLALFYSGRETEAFATVYPFIKRYYEAIVKIFADAAGELGNMRGRQKQFAVGFTGILNHHIMMAGHDAGDNEALCISNETTYEIVHQFMYGIYS